jgi:hypothetical protein
MRIHLLLLLLPVVACGLGRTETFPATAAARPAEDTPASFSPVDTGGKACRTPLRDPRDGAEIVLVRSANGVGDYAVSEGRYGVTPRELLRLECGTARVLGIVPR